jgi:hypothetical protein
MSPFPSHDTGSHGGQWQPASPSSVYAVRRSYWSWLGRVTRIFGPDGSLVCHAEHPALTLRQTINLFADEQQTRPLVSMQARAVISMHHDVFDPTTGQRIGSVRTRGLGILRGDEWDLLDAEDQPIGHMTEGPGKLLRRVFPIVKNGNWDIEIGGQHCAHIREQWRPFTNRYSLDLSMNDGRMHPVFAMACALLALNREPSARTKAD